LRLWGLAWVPAFAGMTSVFVRADGTKTIRHSDFLATVCSAWKAGMTM
jgi:hypothetical protein